MLQQIERPLDMLALSKEKKVIVLCKAYKEYTFEGILKAFDLNINIVLEVFEDNQKKLRFIRGDNVICVEEKK